MKHFLWQLFKISCKQWLSWWSAKQNLKKKFNIGISKGIQIPESGTFLLVEPEILGFEMNLEFKFHWQGMRNPVQSIIHILESRI